MSQGRLSRVCLSLLGLFELGFVSLSGPLEQVLSLPFGAVLAGFVSPFWGCLSRVFLSLLGLFEPCFSLPFEAV